MAALVSIDIEEFSGYPSLMKVNPLLKGTLLSSCLLGLIPLSISSYSFVPVYFSPVQVRKLLADKDFDHHVGKAAQNGWQLDHKRDRPGYALASLRQPLLLEPGIYRATFVLRRGQYPRKGFLFNTYGVFRLELWDMTLKTLINKRELQIGDFNEPNQFQRRWMDFSMRGREGHLIEPRVYWIGLANAGLESVEIDRWPEPSLEGLEDKAQRFGDYLERYHLENGFVVSRKPNGDPDEEGDATTYTSFYVASLAWKYGVTKDALTYQALENGLQTLHNTIKGTFDEPILTRFVNGDGTPHPNKPSKDVYTAFFFAYASAFPFIRNEALKNQMKQDVERVANRFLKEGLTVRGGNQTLITLTPYYTEAEVRSGIRELLSNKKLNRNFLKSLKRVPRYIPFMEPWPTMKEVIRAVQRQDEEELVRLVVPTLNGLADLIERARNILREQYRQDLFPKRFRNHDYPGRKLADLLTVSLKKLPPKKDGRRFERLSDLRVLASNALISLHIVQTAETLTKKPQFKTYYEENLFGQDALLATAIDWYAFEEDLMALAAGNSAADRLRRGYLSALSLYNLIQHEANPNVKEKYQAILDRWWQSYKNEDNPMAMAFQAACSKNKDADVDLILRDLELYPEDRTGFGEAFWESHGEDLANAVGGGAYKGYSREPMPVSHRPKDSFLWQRNARRLKGDFTKAYPPTDYLFVYWFCRYHGLIPETPPQPSVQR